MDYGSLCSTTALYALRLFLAAIVSVCIWNARLLFLQRRGWQHRMAGAIHLLLLVLGAWMADLTNDQQQYLRLPSLLSKTSRRNFFAYDLILGCLGVAATLTAASNFPHKLVSNAELSGYVQSGTLHRAAIVTQAEMIEHAFYQGLNLLQAMYLHAMCNYVSDTTSGDGGDIANLVPLRLFLLWLVTAPWYFRSLLPVHSFSHNWKLHREQHHEQQSSALKREATISRRPGRSNNGNNHNISHDNEQLEVILYRVKKTQYLFYKHCILHGVNLTVVLHPAALDEIPYQSPWRTFWVLLNASYVMEFFLQTMVKRTVIDQSTMLWCQRVLMGASSLGAIVVLRYVPIWIFSLSLLLNFVHRGHDVANTMGIALLGLALTSAGG